HQAHGARGPPAPPGPHARGGAGGRERGPDPRGDPRFRRGAELRGVVLSGRTFLLLGAAGTLFIFAFVVPALALAGLGLDALVVLLALVDARRASRRPLAVRRRLPPILHQGEATPAPVAIENPGREPLDLSIRETLSPLLLDRPLRTARLVPART